MEELREQLLGSGPRVPVFEGDRMSVELRIKSRHGTRGPARIWGSYGGTDVSAAAGRVPKDGWSESRVLGPLHRGPVGVRGLAVETGDPLGFFTHRGKGSDSELTLVLPRFKALADRPHAREPERGAATLASSSLAWGRS